MLPTKILVDLDEINGTSCGSLSHQFELDENANPPRYNPVSGQGPFMSGHLLAIKDTNGDIINWDLVIVYFNFGHSCHGLHAFRLSTASEDPLGGYCKWDGSATDCADGKASVEEDC